MQRLLQFSSKASALGLSSGTKSEILREAILSLSFSLNHVQALPLF